MSTAALLLFANGGWLSLRHRWHPSLTTTFALRLAAFHVLLGLGTVMNDPAWQAITPEVCPPNHSAAVA